MEPPGSLILAHNGAVAGGIHEIGCHEYDQDGPHPIETEALGSLVPNDVRNTCRRFGIDLVGHRSILRSHACGHRIRIGDGFAGAGGPACYSRHKLTMLRSFREIATQRSCS